jgi:hypothetical protein
LLGIKIQPDCIIPTAQSPDVGGNAATLLVKVDKGAMTGKDLSHAVVLGADFTNASLRQVNFTSVAGAATRTTSEAGSSRPKAVIG